ncbi:MAG: histidine--tRNA ligase [Pseudomonadota bacterium]|nr:histidine--tRNA ligase [Pseudomonadota bacterium]
MAKPTVGALTGFPEWLPHQRMVEQDLMDRIRRRYELHGYVPLETRSVEPLDTLVKKGATDKEIYVLRRLHAEDDGDSGLGLHFDLTIPFARYVVQHKNDLTFPFKRYQIQRVWRGERPQDGRFREFYQCDADVIGMNNLPVWWDVEMTMLMREVLDDLPIPAVSIQVNNRKILEGFYRALGITDLSATLRVMDKLDKLGPQKTLAELEALTGLPTATASRCLDLASISGSDLDVLRRIEALGYTDPLLQEGLSEMELVLRETASLPAGRVVANLRIARGLDYYTGVVYEGVMAGHEQLGSVCSGGRYDNLASVGKDKLPGIGVSIGLSRILGRLFGRGMLDMSRKSPTCVLVALATEETRADARAVAESLRARGIATEVFDRPLKWGKQIEYADAKGIPYVWFPAGEKPDHEVRDLRSRTQAAADVASWMPEESVSRPAIVRKEG